MAISQFGSSGNVDLPILITGRLISVGDYFEKNFGLVKMTEEVLKENMQQWVNIAIYKTHEVFARVKKGLPANIDDVLGKITKVEWGGDGINFFAEVSDRNIAIKIINALIKFISAGFGRDIVSTAGKFFYRNLIPLESAFVFDPRDKKAMVQLA